MFRYIIRRLIGVAVLLVVISFITFMLFFAIPNNPAALSCGKGCTPEVIKATEHKMGIDQPIMVQYGKYMKGIVAGREFGEGSAINKCPAPCLGFSFRSDRPVTDLIVDALPITLSISIGAFVLWVTFGVATGVISALKRGTVIDRVVMFITLATVSLPAFFTGLMMLYFIVIKFGLMTFPSYVGFLDNPFLWAQNLLLPWLTLAFLFAALYTRLTRANMLETMGEDYIRTARAKGLAERKVIFKHGLRAALTPIVTIAGLDLGALLGGAVITESVYNFNGLGRLIVRSVTDLDLPVLVGVTVLAAFFIVMLNFLVDLLYAAIDPRVRLV
jgi:peptide/nickel transport system permease protein